MTLKCALLQLSPWYFPCAAGREGHERPRRMDGGERREDAPWTPDGCEMRDEMRTTARQEADARKQKRLEAVEDASREQDTSTTQPISAPVRSIERPWAGTVAVAAGRRLGVTVCQVPRGPGPPPAHFLPKFSFSISGSHRKRFHVGFLTEAISAGARAPSPSSDPSAHSVLLTYVENIGILRPYVVDNIQRCGRPGDADNSDYCRLHRSAHRQLQEGPDSVGGRTRPHIRRNERRYDRAARVARVTDASGPRPVQWRSETQPGAHFRALYRRYDAHC
ncbi:hypothetical protein FOMPIDRAFT_1015491 [Fomitopsis schrenkii]|uniref:Uncharacterized protein n=1 Tax=Fomitopsis schrenkii TaxID=2126942 RepID=S8EC10_FOMSC|nr:hypothetical protein FOMPIDRAFT_1015491 [Fomitopsis schrenkii]